MDVRCGIRGLSHLTRFTLANSLFLLLSGCETSEFVVRADAQLVQLKVGMARADLGRIYPRIEPAITIKNDAWAHADFANVLRDNCDEPGRCSINSSLEDKLMDEGFNWDSFAYSPALIHANLRGVTTALTVFVFDSTGDYFIGYVSFGSPKLRHFKNELD